MGLRRLASVAVFVGWGAASCGAPPLFLEAPEVDGARSWVLALERGTRLEVHATDAPSGAVNLALDEAEGEAPLRVTRVSFSRALSELGWPAGRLGSSGSPNQTLGSVRALAVEAAEFTGEAESARLEPAELSPELSAFLVPRALSCPTFRDEVGGTYERIQNTAATPSGLGLAISYSELHLVRGPSDYTVVPLPAGERGDAVAVSDLGRVWVATSSAIRSFDPTLQRFEADAVWLPSGSKVLGLLVNEAGATLEIWILDREARFFRYDGTSQSFTLMHEIDPARLDRGFQSSLVAFARRPGGGFFAGSRELSPLVEYDPAVEPAFSYPLASKGFGAVYERSAEAVIAASVLPGIVWQYEGGLWTRLFEDKAEISGIAPLGQDRLLYATRVGGLGIMDPPGPQCPERLPPSGISIRSLAPAGAGFVHASLLSGRGEVIGWLGPEAPALDP